MKTLPRKKIRRVRLDFELDRDAMCISLAECKRHTSKKIGELVGLTEGQVAYTLRKAKEREGMKPGHTYRSAWTNGTSKWAQKFDAMFAEEMLNDVKRRLPPLFVHPHPDTVPE